MSDYNINENEYDSRSGQKNIPLESLGANTTLEQELSVKSIDKPSFLEQAKPHEVTKPGKNEISEQARDSIENYLSLLDQAEEIPVAGLKSTFSVEVDLDRDHELSEIIHGLNDHEYISHKELFDIIETASFFISLSPAKS